MPWRESYYPASMKQLAPPVRRKVIEIANGLLESGHPEGQSIRIGIASAKKWAARRRAIPWRGYRAYGAD
ncbi:MAG TPA: hypothetical protein VEV21_05460 [Burkholderiales bacterium]|nr:hypothetical protein [Burkholderiales bacterium]